MSDNTPRSPFASNIKKLSITNWEGREVGINPQVVQIKIWQSLFTKAMSVELQMSESVDLIQKLPIRGGEKISIELETPGQALLSTDFVVHSVTGYRPDSLRQGSRYTILGVHESALMNKKRLVSRAFRGGCADIVATIAKEFLGIERLTTSQTPTELKYIAPNVSAHRAIDMAAAYAAGDSEDGSLLFFQNQDGHFFRTFTDIVDKGADWEYVLTNQQQEGTDKDDLFRIVEITEPSRTKFADMYNRGSACSTLIQLNPLTRTFNKKHVRREDAIKSSVVTGKQEVDTSILDRYRPDNPETELPMQTYYRFDETAFGLPRSDILSTFGQSLSLVAQLKTNTTTITVPMNTSVKVGDRIKVLAATHDAFDALEVDPHRDAPYVITSIMMVYAVDEQTYMVVDMARDGAATSPETTRMVRA